MGAMRVVDILMNRDGLTKEEASDLVNETRQCIYNVLEGGSYDEVEDIMYENLGLEMDYITDIL